MFNEKYNLTRIIRLDLINHGKIPMLLLLTIMFSAILILVITNENRSMNTKYHLLKKQSNQLNMDWHNLTLEKNVLTSDNRIERIAKTLNMHHVDSCKYSTIITQKNGGIIIINDHK